MLKLRTNRAGFSSLEIILLIVVVGLVCGGAGYIINNKQDKDDAKNIQPTTAPAAKADITKVASSDPSAGWLQYEVPGKYSVKLADGWALQHNTGSDNLYTYDLNTVIYKQGTKATVTDVSGGRDGSGGLFISYISTASEVSRRGEKKPSLSSSDGIEIEKYVFTQTVNPEGPDLQKGGTEYIYILTKGSNTVQVNYAINPGQPQDLDTVEKVVETIKFL